jgi:hypothetical protein
MTKENAATGKISLARGLALLNTLAWWNSAEGEGVMTMRALLILAAIICFSAPAFAQTGTPKVGGKRLKQVKPLAPMGCKFVGTVKGTKLWAGDCAAASELRGTTPAAEPAAPAPAPEPNPPAADKQ